MRPTRTDTRTSDIRTPYCTTEKCLGLRKKDRMPKYEAKATKMSTHATNAKP